MDTTWAHWNATQIATAAQAALAHKRAALEHIIGIPQSERTFDNTIGGLARASDEVNDISQVCSFLMLAHPETAIRTASQEASDLLDAQNIVLDYDRRLWQCVQDTVVAVTALTPEDARLYTTTLRDMRRMGFALPQEQFEQLKVTQTQLQKLQTEFEKAISDWEDGILVTHEQLRGLPQSYIDRLDKRDGQYWVSLEYPDLYPYLQQAHDTDKRKELATKRYQRGGAANMDRLAQMVMLRQEIAGLLGYASHADYVTEVNMVESKDHAEHFLTHLIEKLRPLAHAELRDLIDFKKKTLGLDKHAPIHFYEFAYWAHQFKKERYQLDTEQLKEYFPLDEVVRNMLTIYQELLGLRFEKSDTVLWHPDAAPYTVTDRETGKMLGMFTLDLYPREGKYGHAAAFPILLPRRTAQGTQSSAFLALVCNFSQPLPNNPTLLSIGEVETLFHEFGHVMHGMVSGGTWQLQNGFGVAGDFVEALSQIFEYWVWEPSVLARISQHHQTREPLPPELRAKMLASRKFMQADDYLMQATNALYDIRIHGQSPSTPVDAPSLRVRYQEMALHFCALDLPDSAIYPAGWSHMADYDARYYGYLWSRVYAADMYTRFAPNPLDSSVGAAYRQYVLGPGASKEEKTLVQDFLGRPSTDEAFLRELGMMK